MKIFYTSSVHGIDEDLDQVCPFKNKIEGREKDIYIGSRSCCDCPYCYGYGQHPNPWHNLMVLPFYSRYSKDNENRSDSEIAEDGLKNFKFVSDCDYVKCMMAYSDYGRNMRKNKFKLWWWKHIGKHLSDARCYIIDLFVNLKIKLKGY